MLPIVLDLKEWPILVVGRGEAMFKRLALLDAAGAENVSVHVLETDDLKRARGRRIVPRLPKISEIGLARVLIGAGLTPEEEARVGNTARQHKTLLNIEDRLPWCDFHVPAIVRRGDLVIGVSTGGRGPAVASALRGWLQRRFGIEWGGYLVEAANLRERLRAEGKGPAAVITAVRALPFIRTLEAGCACAPAPLPPAGNE
jgi:precorrin-2 dehydrogenase/sirohydrochlorin ferrochelatase